MGNGGRVFQCLLCAKFMGGLAPFSIGRLKPQRHKQNLPTQVSKPLIFLQSAQADFGFIAVNPIRQGWLRVLQDLRFNGRVAVSLSFTIISSSTIERGASQMCKLSLRLEVWGYTNSRPPARTNLYSLGRPVLCFCSCDFNRSVFLLALGCSH